MSEGSLTPELAVELLVAAAPGFAGSEWDPGEERVEPTGRPHLVLTCLALHAVDRLRTDAGADLGDLFEAADAVLAEGPPSTVEAVQVAFVESLVCLTSHADGPGPDVVIARIGARTWQCWHQSHERSEALSLRPAPGEHRAEGLIEAEDRWLAGFARATCYRAENGRLVSLTDRAMAEADPAPPWLQRHAAVVGAVFVLIIVLMLWSVR